jgi:hypothetical protein
VSILAIFAASGVTIANPNDVAGEIVTSLSSGGVYAIIGVVASSVIFPIWNAVQKGAVSFDGIFKSTLTWIAIGNIVFSAIALTGLVLPEGTVEGLVYAIASKDWNALISMVLTTILPTVVRFFKK